ncbi:hypothetical protein GC167_04405 [bacterium]|nr:hypothetical protein [bacterium]
MYDFFNSAVPDALRRLRPDATPRWGILSATDMVDHLTRAIRMSLIDEPREIRISEDKRERYWAFLRSDKPMARHLRSPQEFYDIAIQEVGFDEARIRLLRTLIDMQLLYTKKPDFSSIHPDFGRLDVALWTALHMKHFRHHFEQFGLMGGGVNPSEESDGRKSVSSFL